MSFSSISSLSSSGVKYKKNIDTLVGGGEFGFSVEARGNGSAKNSVNGTLGTVDSYYIVTDASGNNTVRYTFNNPTTSTKIRLLLVGATGGTASNRSGAGAGAFLDISFNLTNTATQYIDVSLVGPTSTSGTSSGMNTHIRFSGTSGAIVQDISLSGGPFGNNTTGAQGTNGASNSGSYASNTPLNTFTTRGYSINNSGNITVRGYLGGTSNSTNIRHGGGGGAGGNGGNATSTAHGDGGPGKISDITGTNVEYGKGGKHNVVDPSGNGIFIMKILQI
jgi:hypothetical protein